MNTAHQQLQSIQSMLAAGHRSVHLERHSLLLIGAVGGFIAGLTEYIITVENFPNHNQRALALLIWLSFWMLAMSFTDHQLTRRARLRRDETLPFAQAQITRAWWMLLCMGILGSFAMSFYGGGAMIYALWIVLLGLGVYLFGLFSKPLVEWIGLATILLGVTGLAAGLPYCATHWLATSCFAIGMPLAGWLNRRYGDARLTGRVLALLVWMGCVTAPALALAKTPFAAVPSSPAIALDDMADIGNGEQVLRLAAGTPVALRLDLSGPFLAAKPSASLTMNLTVPLEVALHDGMPDGRYRVADGAWHEIHEGILDLRIYRLSPQLEDGKPVVRAQAEFAGHFFNKDRK